MLWTWWGIMAVTGLLLGVVGAISTGRARVFMKTLSIPLVVALSRLLTPGLFPEKNTAIYLFVDFFLVAVTALITDYLFGLKLGRNDKAGYRQGHGEAHHHEH